MFVNIVFHLLISRQTQTGRQTDRRSGLGLQRQTSTTSAEYTSDVVYFEWQLMETGRARAGRGKRMRGPLTSLLRRGCWCWHADIFLTAAAATQHQQQQQRRRRLRLRRAVVTAILARYVYLFVVGINKHSGRFTLYSGLSFDVTE